MMTKRKFPWIVSVLLLGVFVFGATTGIFLYASGESVLESTYMKMVSHTEYRYGEDGQIIARLVNFQGDPITVNNCTADILYPNKTYFVDDGLMSTSTITGDHYYNFTTPTGPEGVYEYQATCFYTVGSTVRNQSVTNSFHLSSAFTNVLSNLTQIQNDVTTLDDITLFSDSGDGVDVSTFWSNYSGFNSYWNVSYSGIGDIGFNPGALSQEGNALKLGYDSIAGDGVYLNLTDSEYAVLSQEEKFSDVTYEFAAFVNFTQLATGDEIYASLSDWVSGPEIDFAIKNSTQFGGISAFLVGNGVNGLQGVEIKDDLTWYTVSLHVNDWDTSSETATLDVYLDGVLIASQSDLNTSDFETFTLYAGGYDNPTVPFYLDNIRVYEGSPVDKKFLEQKIYDNIAELSDQLNTNTTTILDAIANISIDVNFTEVLDAISNNASYIITSLSEDTLFADSFESGTLGEWSATGNVSVQNDVGYSDVYAALNVYGLVLGSNETSYVRLNTTNYTQDFDEVTVEYMFEYIDGRAPGEMFYDYDTYGVYLGGNADGTLYFVAGSTQLDYGPVTEGWHVVQIYTEQQADDSYTAEVYIDDVSIGFVDAINWSGDAGNPDEIGFWGTITPTFFDNVQIYEGEPENRGLLLAQILSGVTVLDTAINGNFTLAFSYLDDINVTVTDVQTTVDAMELVLANVNTTTTNTYDYVTGTLTNSVGQALTTLGVINATVNRIETNTLDINSTVNTILENQENEVMMTVFSG